jgi:hypothetical protein
MILAGRGGFEPPTLVLETTSLPLAYRPRVAAVGFEPTYTALSEQCAQPRSPSGYITTIRDLNPELNSLRGWCDTISPSKQGEPTRIRTENL